MARKMTNAGSAMPTTPMTAWGPAVSVACKGGEVDRDRE